MSTIRIAALITAAMAVVVALLAGAVLVRVGDDPRERRTLRVSGEGMVLVAPDHATVGATVEGRHADARAALQEANRRMRGVLRALADAGVDEDQLTTTSVQTRREHRGPREAEPGDWVATIGVRVEIDDLELVGDVLAAASSAGAQHVDGPAYTVRDPAAAYRRALDQAMDRARAKAETLADQAGSDIGDVLTVEEARELHPTYASTTALMAGAADAESIAVTPGETEQVRARVTVTFEHDG